MSIKDNEISFVVDTAIFSQEAILMTCYVYLDRFYLFMDKEGRKVKIYLRPKQEKSLGLKDCQGEFLNELINNTLRLMISKRNQKIREMIVKEALFFSQPKEDIDKSLLGLDTDIDSKDWQDDPLGIATPWEEKFAKAKRKK